MAIGLCDLCRKTPLNSLPPPLSNRGYTLLGTNRELVQLRSNSQRGDEPFIDPLGCLWHENLDALAESAKLGCPLCSLVQDGAQKWIENYRKEEKNNLMFIEFDRDHNPIPHGQNLWLTQRLSGGDGFIVLVRHPDEKEVVNLLTSVGFIVGASSPLATRFTSRPLESDSSSLNSLEVVTSWLKTCDRNHKECNAGKTMLPSRILDISSSGDTIKLVDDASQISGYYVCLSYCWGQSHTFMTTQDSYEALTSGVQVSDLPKTFRDAIRITRHLGLRYLWIDSICIFQDVQNDWARESAAMNKVYSEAYLVIAANHAEDGSGGCFHIRKPRRKVTFTIPDVGEVQAQLVLSYDERSWGIEFDDEPLCQRGWALQERVLARRVLHYNSGQMYFECNNGLASEDGCRSDRFCDLRKITSDKADPLKVQEFQRLWYQLLWSYGNRKLTKPTDKLIAFSGLAKLFESQFHDNYVAGLWSKSLMEGLSWQGLGTGAQMSTSEYTGPSWSWASYDGMPANTPGSKEWRDVAEVKGWHVDLKHEVNPYGAISHSWIQIYGPLAKLTPGSKEVTDLEVRLQRARRTPLPRLRTKYSEQDEGSLVNLDSQQVQESGEWRNWDLYVLVLRGLRNQDDGNDQELQDQSAQDGEGRDNAKSHKFCYGLVLSKLENGHEPVMKRVGWMFVNRPEITKLVCDEACWTTVTLL